MMKLGQNGLLCNNTTYKNKITYIILKNQPLQAGFYLNYASPVGPKLMGIAGCW